MRIGSFFEKRLAALEEDLRVLGGWYFYKKNEQIFVVFLVEDSLYFKPVKHQLAITEEEAKNIIIGKMEPVKLRENVFVVQKVPDIFGRCENNH